MIDPATLPAWNQDVAAEPNRTSPTHWQFARLLPWAQSFHTGSGRGRNQTNGLSGACSGVGEAAITAADPDGWIGGSVSGGERPPTSWFTLGGDGCRYRKERNREENHLA